MRFKTPLFITAAAAIAFGVACNDGKRAERTQTKQAAGSLDKSSSAHRMCEWLRADGKVSSDGQVQAQIFDERNCKINSSSDNYAAAVTIEGQCGDESNLKLTFETRDLTCNRYVFELSSSEVKDSFKRYSLEYCEKIPRSEPDLELSLRQTDVATHRGMLVLLAPGQGEYTTAELYSRSKPKPVELIGVFTLNLLEKSVSFRALEEDNRSSSASTVKSFSTLEVNCSSR
jgi:hypothetical protein